MTRKAAPAYVPPAPAGGARSSPEGRRQRRYSVAHPAGQLTLAVMVAIPSLILFVFILLPLAIVDLFSFTDAGTASAASTRAFIAGSG